MSHTGIRRSIAGLALAALWLVPSPALAVPFTFAGVSFDPVNTPDVFGLLGNSVNLGGALFAAGLPTDITQSVGFGASSGTSAAGFVEVGAPGPYPGGADGTDWPGNPTLEPPSEAAGDTGLSLGEMACAQAGLDQPSGGCSLFSSAVNLPAGNAGGTTRQGLEVSWSGARELINGAGNDFVVYESGSSGAPEGFMVRVRSGSTYSGWYFVANAGFGTYVGSSDGAFATVFNLDLFGIAALGTINQIQLANLITADRLDAGGLVNFGGIGSTHGFASGSLDPDPLYIGVIEGQSLSAVPEPASLLLLGSGLLGLAAARRRSRS